LIDRLGAGGCGVVYLAEQIEPVKRKVALKIIRLGMDTESVIARFVMERESLARMEHPNIAKVLDAGATASGRPYFVMELVDGEKVTDFCDRKCLNLRERLELFMLICEAIQHAHQKGVIHRDIKPSNVLVIEQNGHHVPKVIDFGIAKATAGGFDGDATYTLAGQIVGTPAYMSPEQAMGSADIDTTSDVYSLGAMLYELLAGRPPFAHESFKDQPVDQIRTILREQEPGPPSARLKTTTSEEITMIAGCRSADARHLPSQLAGDLDWIVMKATEKDRSRRYETANALAMDIRRYLADEPVLARPPSRRYRLIKLVKRNRLVYAAGAVALFGLLAGFGTSTWLFVRERKALHEQTRLRAAAEKAGRIAIEARANEARMNRAAKAASVISQAAVLEKYGQKDEADQLLDQLEAEDMPGSLEAFRTLFNAANSHLSKQHWDKAAHRFFLLAHVRAKVDPTDNNSQVWLAIAPAVLEWGKPGQFEKVRELALEQFSETTSPAVAEHLLRVTLLTPPDERVLRVVAPAAKVLADSLEEPDKLKNAHLAANARCDLALLSYRQGDLENAAKLARRSLENLGDPARNHWNQTILAMVDFRQGRKEEAGEKLNEVHAGLASWEAKPLRPDVRERLGWTMWGCLRILLREADALLAAEKSKAVR